jgi:hypothetical protein
VRVWRCSAGSRDCEPTSVEGTAVRGSAVTRNMSECSASIALRGLSLAIWFGPSRLLVASLAVIALEPLLEAPFGAALALTGAFAIGSFDFSPFSLSLLSGVVVSASVAPAPKAALESPSTCPG